MLSEFAPLFAFGLAVQATKFPTYRAMSAILIVLASRYGLEGMWIAGVMAGIFILLMGLFNLGQIVNFIFFRPLQALPVASRLLF